ncbi:unnamed protein product [Ectocarpus sp. CCAP 1310/34]|nr:unnamed protein product [Ectocarpus sp. CCAP 1310/34]
MVRIAVPAIHLVGCVLLLAKAGAEDPPPESCQVDVFPNDEFAVCNVGSSCRGEYNRANGTLNKMWQEEIGIVWKRINSERSRVMLNEYQPVTVPKFTELGYKKEKLNPDTYAYLMEWYHSQMENKAPVTEKWAPDNTYVNHWEVDTKMTAAPTRIHRRLYQDLLPVMEEWSGIKLKSTACYGVRHYYRGSILANHVDRVDTHVISAIINENVDTDWGLYVRGHDGVARDLFIEPGEIIFYESASVIHGRPQAFQGSRFANIFVHFSPAEGWDVTTKDVQRAANLGKTQKGHEESATDKKARAL